MHTYKQKHQRYEQHKRLSSQKAGISTFQSTQTGWNKFVKTCCFPAFWLLLIILALVFGMFFVIVAKDKIGGVDLSNIKKVEKQSSQQPNNSLRITNSNFLQKDIDLPSGSHKLSAYVLPSIQHYRNIEHKSEGNSRRHSLRIQPASNLQSRNLN